MSLKDLRLKSFISQEELSKKSGVSRPIISKIENGKIEAVSTRSLAKLAEALGVSVAELF